MILTSEGRVGAYTIYESLTGNVRHALTNINLKATLSEAYAQEERLCAAHILGVTVIRHFPLMTLKSGENSGLAKEQIIAVLRVREGGLRTAELRSKHGTDTATLDAWKTKFAGMDVSEAKQLKKPDHENATPKRPLADSTLDHVVLKDLPHRSQAQGARAGDGHTGVDRCRGFDRTPADRSTSSTSQTGAASASSP